MLHWNSKYCRVQIENVSYWLTDKQSMSNHVSLCQDMRFSIGFLIIINKLQILNWVQLESLETINKLLNFCTLYLSSKPNISPSPVAIVKSHGKKCQNYFRVSSPHNSLKYIQLASQLDEIDEIAREEGNQEKDDGF